MSTHTTISRSTATTTTWSHLFKIRDYSHTKILGPNASIKSGRFPGGGHSWRVYFYPDRGDPGLVHWKLEFTRGGDLMPPASAIVSFTLLPRGGSRGEPLTLTRTFEPSWENPMVDMKREDVERCVGDDDSLAIRCDVRAVQTIEEFHGQAPSYSSSGMPARPSWIKNAWLGFTRRLLPASTARDDTRQLLAWLAQERVAAAEAAEWRANQLLRRRPLATQAPLTPAIPVMAKLGYFSYSADGRRASDKQVCMICLEALVDGEKCGKVTVCQHLFHKNCIDGWMKTKTTCPLCRRRIVQGSD